jgi:hypothetical protein
VIALTFFLCWAIYYFVASVHKWYRITKKAENIIDQLDSIVTRAKERFHGSAAYLMALSETAKKVFEFIKEKREENFRQEPEKKKEKTTKKKKK